MEIRLKIWKLALPRPRVVELRFSRSEGSDEHDYVYGGGSPMMLQVCMKSRLVALKTYHLAFGNEKWHTLFISTSRSVHFTSGHTVLKRGGSGGNGIKSKGLLGYFPLQILTGFNSYLMLNSGCS
jgi:hypothetical protein